MSPTIADERIAPVKTSTNNQTLTIRQYRPEDNAAVIDLFRDGMMEYADPSIPQYKVIVDYVANAIATDLADIEAAYLTPGGNFWVATAVNEENGEKEEVVGTIAVSVKRTDGEGELFRMSVKKTHRRFGLGRKLLQHAEDWAKRQNYTHIILQNSITMTQAHQFYLANGYMQTATTKFCEEPCFKLANFVKYL